MFELRVDLIDLSLLLKTPRQRSPKRKNSAGPPLRTSGQNRAFYRDIRAVARAR
jgi:hypothetical protein